MCRFSESGGSCWVKLASETEANETHVALDGSLWEGSRLSVRQTSDATDENSTNLENTLRSQQLEKSKEVKDESHVASKGRLRMDEEEERRRKRKRPGDKEVSLRTEENWKRRRETWGL